MPHRSSKTPIQPRPVSKIAQDLSGAMSQLVDKARNHQRVESLLSKILDAPTASNCKVANIKQHTLVLFAPSPVWATRIKLMSDTLLLELQKAGFEALSAIDVRVLPQGHPEPQTPRPKRLSDAARTVLGQFADGCKDADLKAIAIRMSGKKDG